MTTFLLLLKYFFWSVLCTLLQVVFLSVTKLLLEYNFRVLFTPLAICEKIKLIHSKLYVAPICYVSYTAPYPPVQSAPIV